MMDAGVVALITLLIFLALTILRLPMGIGLGVASLFAIFNLRTLNLSILGQVMVTANQSYVLIAIPLFIFAGNVMSEGGIAGKLVNVAKLLVRRITGGLGMVEAIACAFFAAISGSSTATTVAIGSMMTPDLIKKGYKKDFALAIAACGGVVGPIIPPSICFVLYAVSSSSSVIDLFTGGILPGIIMTLFVCIAIYLVCKKKGYDVAENDDRTASSTREPAGKILWDAKWALMTPIIILGGIYSGLFTPTEAAAVACFYSIVVSVFIEKNMSWKRLWEMFIDAGIMTARIMFLMGVANVFGRVMTMAQVPKILSEAIISLSDNRYVIMFLINILLLFVGCIMDPSASILILTPILLPVVQAYGFSTLQFGIIMVTNLCIGAVTPPVGCCLFAASAMGKEKIENVAKAAFPLLVAQLLVLFLEIVCAPISTFLPSLI